MRLDHRPVYVVRLTRTVISNGAHQEIEFENPIRVCYILSCSYETACLPKRFRLEGHRSEYDFSVFARLAPPTSAAPMPSVRFPALQSEYSAPFQRPPSAQVLCRLMAADRGLYAKSSFTLHLADRAAN
jgi:hypothetical protein